jgi:hypothetical protein
MLHGFFRTRTRGWKLWYRLIDALHKTFSNEFQLQKRAFSAISTQTHEGGIIVNIMYFGSSPRNYIDMEIFPQLTNFNPKCWHYGIVQFWSFITLNGLNQMKHTRKYLTSCVKSFPMSCQSHKLDAICIFKLYFEFRNHIDTLLSFSYHSKF